LIEGIYIQLFLLVFLPKKKILGFDEFHGILLFVLLGFGIDWWVLVRFLCWVSKDC